MKQLKTTLISVLYCMTSLYLHVQKNILYDEESFNMAQSNTAAQLQESACAANIS